MPRPAKRKSYMEVLQFFLPLSIFAGGFTLATQFIIACPNTRLQSLLSLASQLFLASLLADFYAFLLLYGFEDTDKLTDIRHTLVVMQLTLVGAMMAAAFLVLSTAIIVAGHRLIGIMRLVLMVVVVFATIYLGYSIYGNEYEPRRTQSMQSTTNVDSYQKPEELKDHQPLILFISWLLEVFFFLVLLGVGGYASQNAAIPNGCPLPSHRDKWNEN